MPVIGFAFGQWTLLTDGQPWCTTTNRDDAFRLELALKQLRVLRAMYSSSHGTRVVTGYEQA